MDTLFRAQAEDKFHNVLKASEKMQFLWYRFLDIFGSCPFKVKRGIWTYIENASTCIGSTYKSHVNSGRKTSLRTYPPACYQSSSICEGACHSHIVLISHLIITPVLCGLTDVQSHATVWVMISRACHHELVNLMLKVHLLMERKSWWCSVACIIKVKIKAEVRNSLGLENQEESLLLGKKGNIGETISWGCWL